MKTLLLMFLLLNFYCECNENFLQKFHGLGEEKLFYEFHKLHEKNYHLNSEEALLRFENFKKNLIKIKLHNENPNRTYDLGVTFYADWSEEEWQARNPKRPNNPKNFDYKYRPNNVNAQKFQPIDWTKKGIKETENKEGGTACRNSYVLAHTYLVEAWNYFKTGSYKSLSPQNIVDCSTWDCTQFTNLNWDDDYNFLYSYGFYENSVYPYTGKKDSCKQISSSYQKYSPSIWERPYAGNTDTETVYSFLKDGPLFFCATETVSYLYTSGLFSNYSENILCGFPGNCYSDGFMLVGYGIDPITQEEFWIAKSTFGKSWGEQGYIRIKRKDEYQNMGINCLFMRPTSKMD